MATAQQLRRELYHSTTTNGLFQRLILNIKKIRFFLNEAKIFILHHPGETVINSFWKFFGFWSPLRVRTGHWSDSSLKTILYLLYQTPILLLFFASVIRYFTKQEFRLKKEKGILMLFLFFWMVPHLLYFSSSRFRAPIDFILLILALDFVVSIFPNLSRARTNSYD